MVAAAVMMIIALGAATMMVDMNKSANTTRQRFQMESLHEEIRVLLGNSAACRNTLGAVSITSITGAATQPVTEIRDRNNSVRYTTGDIYGDRSTRILNMVLRNYVAGAGDGGEITLQITYVTALEQVGSREAVRTVNLSTTANTTTGALQACVARAKMSDGLWQRNTANVSDISFLGRNVGIGTEAPEQRLHIMGPDPVAAAIESSNGNNPLLTFIGIGGIGVGSGNGGISFSNRQITGPLNPAIPQWGPSLAIIQPVFTGSTAVSGADLMFVVKEQNGPPRERMRLMSHGGLAIGTSTSVSSLEVAGRAVNGIDRTIGIYPATAQDTAGISFAPSKAAFDAVATTRNRSEIGLATAPGQFGQNTQIGDLAISSMMGRDLHLVARVDNDGNGTIDEEPTRLIVKNTGNVGIGTPTPLTRLHIEGRPDRWAIVMARAYSSAQPAQTGGFIGMRARGSMLSPQYPQLNDSLGIFGGRDAIDALTGANYGGAEISMVAAENHSATSKGTNMQFYTTPLNGSVPQERLRIAANGSVGVNTGAPSERLHVVGNLRVQGGVDCILGNGSGGTNSSSDARLKRDVRLIESPLEKISRLKGVEFTWNEKAPSPGRQDIGVLAQDVEKSFPTAVTEDQESGYKRVDYAVLIAPVIEAIKALARRVAELFDSDAERAREIAVLRAENAALREESARQRTRLDSVTAWICRNEPQAPFCHP